MRETLDHLLGAIARLSLSSTYMSFSPSVLQSLPWPTLRARLPSARLLPIPHMPFSNVCLWKPCSLHQSLLLVRGRLFVTPHTFLHPRLLGFHRLSSLVVDSGARMDPVAQQQLATLLGNNLRHIEQEAHALLEDVKTQVGSVRFYLFN